jgi:hypothetical protein
VIDAALRDALVLRGQYRTFERRYCKSSVNVLRFKAKLAVVDVGQWEPARQDVRNWFRSLNNWRPLGSDDRLDTLNHITDSADPRHRWDSKRNSSSREVGEQ